MWDNVVYGILKSGYYPSILVEICKILWLTKQLRFFMNKIYKVIEMTLIKAKVMDSMHLELEKGIETSEKNVFVRIIRPRVVESAEGAWGYVWIVKSSSKI